MGQEERNANRLTINDGDTTTNNNDTEKNDNNKDTASDKKNTETEDEDKPNSPMHIPSLLCVMSLGFFANVEYGVIMPSIWKYISSLEGTEMQMGVAMSACSAAQVCFLPIFGWWSDKRTMKEVYIVALLLGASAQLFESPWLIVGGRTFIGIYSGVISVSNSFIACVTTSKKRTQFMAHMNGVNALGLVTGPAFNLFLSKVHWKIIDTSKYYLAIDDLTSPAWFVGILLCLSLTFFAFVFREPTPEVVDEQNTKSSILKQESLSAKQFLSFMVNSFTKPWGLCFLINFMQNFDFSVLETVATLFTTNIVMSAEMIIVLMLTAAVSKKLSDRFIILIGLSFVGASLVILIVLFNPNSPFYIMVIIFVIFLIGVASQFTAVMSCYSQLIDIEFPNAKQGLYSGVLMIFGSLARIVGPIWGGFAVGLNGKHSIQILASLLIAFCGAEFLITVYIKIFYGKLRTDQPKVKSSEAEEKSSLLSSV